MSKEKLRQYIETKEIPLTKLEYKTVNQRLDQSPILRFGVFGVGYRRDNVEQFGIACNIGNSSDNIHTAKENWVNQQMNMLAELKSTIPNL